MPVRQMPSPEASVETKAESAATIAEYASVAGQDKAWIRTRGTGNLWEVTGRVLERVLNNPDEYEVLEPDGAGNYIDEKGAVIIAAPAVQVAPAKPPTGNPAIDNEDDF